MRQFYRAGQAESQPSQAVLAASLPTPTPTAVPPNLPPFLADRSMENGITRFASLHTSIPARPRTDVITYTVETGDTLFGIAEKFGLKPETLLWGNQLILADNPHNLQPEQELNILPVDGTYNRWSAATTLYSSAKDPGWKGSYPVNVSVAHAATASMKLDGTIWKLGYFLAVEPGEASTVDRTLRLYIDEIYRLRSI